jgi:hypothetical protein
MSKLKKAAQLSDVYKTVSPEPLMNSQELDAFYNPEIIAIRGEKVMLKIQTRLLRADKNRPFKAFLMGHPGVGKSSALTCLIQETKEHFRAIRFSAKEQLDMVNFKAFDVLLLTVTELAEQCDKPIEQGGCGHRVDKNLIRALWDWYATTEVSKTKRKELTASVGAGIDSESSLWGKLLGLKAKAYAEAKYAGAREKKTVEYRLNNISELVQIANHIIESCNDLLRQANNKQWLIVWEDFDKEGIPKDSIRQLFLEYGHIFNDLNAHMITNIPITLAYSGEARGVIDETPRYLLYDSPVFDKDHKPHKQGQDILRAVLERRMDTALFENGVLESLLIASGGNLRDLFNMVLDATDLAIGDKLNKIGQKHANNAIVTQRTEYERRLGTDRFAEEPIDFDEKIKRLKDIYHNKPDSSRTDNILYSLLRSRAVQEFNGERWFGVHPLVVDYLVRNEHIKPGDDEPFGGTI